MFSTKEDVETSYGKGAIGKSDMPRLAILTASMALNELEEYVKKADVSKTEELRSGFMTHPMMTTVVIPVLGATLRWRQVSGSSASLLGRTLLRLMRLSADIESKVSHHEDQAALQQLVHVADSRRLAAKAALLDQPYEQLL